MPACETSELERTSGGGAAAGSSIQRARSKPRAGVASAPSRGIGRRRAEGGGGGGRAGVAAEEGRAGHSAGLLSRSHREERQSRRGPASAAVHS